MMDSKTICRARAPSHPSRPSTDRGQKGNGRSDRQSRHQRSVFGMRETERGVVALSSGRLVRGFYFNPLQQITQPWCLALFAIGFLRHGARGLIPKPSINERWRKQGRRKRDYSYPYLTFPPPPLSHSLPLSLWGNNPIIVMD